MKPKMHSSRLTPFGVVLAMLLNLVGFQVATGSTSAHASTSQFDGVNWAVPDDNLVTGDIVPVGLADTDDYATTYTKATSILKGFQALGANTVHMAFNQATVSDSWWNGYTAAFDAAGALGMNSVVAPWLRVPWANWRG